MFLDLHARFDRRESWSFSAVPDGEDANIHDCESSHIVVTNIQQLASRADRRLPAFPDDFFDLIMVDEGHHNVARSWERVFERFPNSQSRQPHCHSLQRRRTRDRR